jgi:hypothetical protein
MKNFVDSVFLSYNVCARMEDSKPENIAPKKEARASLRFKKGQEWLKAEYDKLADQSGKALNFNDLAIMALAEMLPGLKKRVAALKGESFQMSAMT